MQPQLYMWSGIRRRILSRHDFYVEQVKARVLSQFQNIESESERYGEEEYQRMASMPYQEDVELSDLAESAYDRGIEFYGLLHDLKKQMMLGSLAGLYHQWEKDLRDFIEREMAHNWERQYAIKIAWDPNVGNVFEVLKQFGLNCRSSDFFEQIDACRLIVNVYKHGKGRSLEELAKLYPEYLNNPLGTFGGIWATSQSNLNHEWLELSEAQFEQLAAGLRRFWVEFPERSFLSKD